MKISEGFLIIWTHEIEIRIVKQRHCRGKRMMREKCKNERGENKESKERNKGKKREKIKGCKREGRE